MMLMTLAAAIIVMIITAVILLLNLTSKKTLLDREKSSPFECGFDPKSSARMPFSLHFFLIAIIFLIFDVEITLLFPLIISMKYNNMLIYTTVMTAFIVILLMGLFHEWSQGALTWTS
uniref:NADH-ubiquinone oxidoreductase chain 3 n=1 Tax=Morphostenophanes yunnanus TaxID=2823840 RepID=A0A8F4PML1_9CUCU|nr:NADH dehydrogenase subunit 3 [Morphostenophanes yunnanus]QXF60329.1 NADH dehydrogenase subunit 3 [Morphostenophanes yunnanus]